MTQFKKVFKEVLTTGMMLAGLFAFRSSVAEPYVVPTGSMEPTIQPGDRLFVWKSAYDWKFPFSDLTLVHRTEPERGDIIVFKYPNDPSINYVKRLIGLPGDEISVRDGFIQINGKNLPISSDQDPKQVHETLKRFYQEQLGKVHYTVQRFSQADSGSSSDPLSGKTLRIKVPADSYFFMGDNRDRSNDSRYWGFVPKSYLKGKALVVWLSLDSSHGWVPSVRWERFGKKLL